MVKTEIPPRLSFFERFIIYQRRLFVKLKLINKKEKNKKSRENPFSFAAVLKSRLICDIIIMILNIPECGYDRI